MKEYRCGKCKKLLGKVIGYAHEYLDDFYIHGLDKNLDPICIEIKCSKCGKFNKFEIKEMRGI